MSTNRTAYSSGYFQFALDGEPETSWLKSVDGGGVKASLIQENVGPDHIQLKHVATVEIDPLTVEVGMAATSPIFRWIQDSWKHRFSRRDGSVVHANFEYASVIEQWFYEALISEVGFPTLDGSDKNPAYLTLKLQPERIELKNGDGQKIVGAEGAKKQKLWSPSSFRLEIDGIDCTHVNKVDAFTVKQKIKPLYIGSSRYPELEPAGIEFPNLTVTMAAAYADDFIKWHQAFVVKGDKDPKHLKSGAIEFLDPRSAETLLTVKLENVGINSLTFEKSEAGAESLKRCKVELFVESMDLDIRAPGLE